MAQVNNVENFEASARFAEKHFAKALKLAKQGDRKGAIEQARQAEIWATSARKFLEGR